MKKLFILAFLLLIGGGVANAQGQFVSGAITTADAGTCSTAGGFVSIQTGGGNSGAVAFSVSGTFSETLQFVGTVDGTNYVAVNAYPPNSTTPVTSTTGAGTWTVGVAGLASFCVRSSAFTSGSATVNMRNSTAVSVSTLTGGGGGGSSGLSGMTAGQVPIAATATTVTSSEALAGSGAAITTGPASSTSGDLVSYTGTAGQTADSGVSMASPGPIGGTTPAAGTFTTLNCGVLNTTACVITGTGSTSGTATLTWPATAGSTTNPIVFSNAIAVNQSGNSAATPSYTFAGSTNYGFYAAGASFSIFTSLNGSAVSATIPTGLALGSTGVFQWGNTTCCTVAGGDTGISRDAAGVVDVGTGAQGSTAGKMQMANLALTGSAPAITAPGTTPYINASGPLIQTQQCSFALTTSTFTLALSPVNLCTWTLPNAAVVWRVNCQAGWSNPAGTTPTFAVGNNWAQTPSGVAADANIGTSNAGVAVEGYTASTSNGNIVATGNLTNSATIFPVTWWTTFTGNATSGAYHPTASLTGTSATGTLVGFCTIQ